MAHTRGPFKWPQWIGTVVSSCNGKSRSLAKIAKIAKTNLLASVPFFFAPFACLCVSARRQASLREDRPGSLAKIAKTNLLASVPLRGDVAHVRNGL